MVRKSGLVIIWVHHTGTVFLHIRACIKSIAYLFLGCNYSAMSQLPLLMSDIIFVIVAMMTSSNGNIFRVIGSFCGEFTGHRWIPRTKASDAKLWCFLDLRLNKRMSKQSWSWWFETPSRSLWRHRNSISEYLLHLFLMGRNNPNARNSLNV